MIRALALAALLALPSSALAVPDCKDRSTPRTIVDGSDSLESVIADSKGRIFYGDTPQNAVMRIDFPGAKPVKLADGIASPGGIVFDSNGDLLVGYGDSVPTALQGQSGMGQAGIYRVNPDTGAKSTYARGTTMSNGLARMSDGTIFASADVGTNIDRVGPGGSPVELGWATVVSPNGMAVDAAEKYLYANQTFTFAAIARIEIAHPENVTSFAKIGPEDSSGGLDGMTIDSAGRLYSAVNLAGEVWRTSTSGDVCALARGMQTTSAVALGAGPTDGKLYIVGFDGKVRELDVPGARAAAGATGPPSTDTTPPRIVLRVRRHGRLARVRVSCSEPCSLKVRSGRRSVSRRLAAGQKLRLRFRVRRGRKFHVRVTAIDAAGNRSVARR